jgi:hypothetical protein
MRWFALSLVLLLTGCSQNVHNKEAVRQGIINHLSARKGLDLDLSAMEVDVSSVAFRENEADATVSFRPKGGGAGGGMQMKYTLERKGNLWAVKSKVEASGSPHGAQDPQGGAGAGELPPGHPPMTAPPASGKGQ